VRQEGWESLLAEHILLAYSRPFAWGSHDCVLWCAEWVRKCTGHDHAEKFKGTYSTAAGAKALMRRRKWKSPEAIADKFLLVKPVMLARRGDIVLHPDGPLGICHGRQSHSLTETGVLAIPTLSCPKVWGVE